MINQISVKSFPDFLSLLPLFVQFYVMITLNYKLMLFIVITIFIHYLIKNATHMIYDPIFKRPDNAFNCNMCNNDGDVSKNPGFPSGHMATISLVMNYYLMQNNIDNAIEWKYIILYNIPCLLVAYARYAKSCHNIPQIIAGYLLGLIMAYIGVYVNFSWLFKSFFD